MDLSMKTITTTTASSIPATSVYLTTTTSEPITVTAMTTVTETVAIAPVCLPPFWRHLPVQWFAHVDAVFDSSRIYTDIARVNYVLSALDDDGVRTIADLLGHHVTYDSVRARLTAAYVVPPSVRFRNMTQPGEMDDRSPSQLLRDIRVAYPSGLTHGTLDQLWFEKLPFAVQTVIAGLSGSLDMLAEKADRVWDICVGNQVAAEQPCSHRAGYRCAAVFPPPCNDVSKPLTPNDEGTPLISIEKRIMALKNAMSALTAQVVALTNSQASEFNRAHSSERHTRDHPQSTSSPPAQVPSEKSTLCYNDVRHGAQTQLCRNPSTLAQTLRTIHDLFPVPETCRLFVSDIRSGHRFLIDSGAVISVIPLINNMQQHYSNVQLVAANGTQIRTYGPKKLHLDLGLKRLFTWTFETADVSRPIIGADFLHYYGLLIDIRRNRLVDLADNNFEKTSLTNAS